jgi:hypothetical protein
MKKLVLVDNLKHDDVHRANSVKQSNCAACGQKNVEISNKDHEP